MPKMRLKSDLPTKICAACGCPFSWREKWKRDWEQVKDVLGALQARASRLKESHERGRGGVDLTPA